MSNDISPTLTPMAASAQTEVQARETREANARLAIKMCCPQCHAASTLELAAIAWIRSVNTQIPIRDSSPADDSPARCDCGWVGNEDDVRAAYGACCKYCGGGPDDVERNDDGWRLCQRCGAEY